MNFPKNIALLLTVVLLSCSSTNVLSYRHRKYYKEGSEFYLEYYGPKPDSLFTLSQYLRYDNPKSIDEEYVEGLTLKILDTAAAKQKVILTLTTDTAIVRSFYGLKTFISYLNPKEYKPRGEITILSWTSEKIEIRENVVVADTGLKKPILFKGKRTFVRNNDMEKLLQSR